MVEESLIPSVLRMFRPPLPEWTHSTGARQADENGSACAQEIFSQDNKLLAQLLTVPGHASGVAGGGELADLGEELRDRKAGGGDRGVIDQAGHDRRGACSASLPPSSASSATAVRGSSRDSAAHSANAPIAYGAPCVIAAAKVCPLVTQPKKIVPSSATPIAPPSCCAVLNSPDAAPAASAGTAASTTFASGMISRASPPPATARPGTTGQELPPTPTSLTTAVTAAVPAAIITPPRTSTRRPYFSARGTAAGAMAKTPALNASAVSPAFSGEKRSPACSQSASMRRKPCRPAANATSTPNPAANAGMPNSRGRSSGAVAAGEPRPGRIRRPRASRTASAAITATPAAINGQVQAGQPSRRPSSSG